MKKSLIYLTVIIIISVSLSTALGFKDTGYYNEDSYVDVEKVMVQYDDKSYYIHAKYFYDSYDKSSFMNYEKERFIIHTQYKTYTIYKKALDYWKFDKKSEVLTLVLKDEIEKERNMGNLIIK